MDKFLTYILILLFTSLANAQIILSEDFTDNTFNDDSFTKTTGINFDIANERLEGTFGCCLTNVYHYGVYQFRTDIISSVSSNFDVRGDVWMASASNNRDAAVGIWAGVDNYVMVSAGNVVITNGKVGLLIRQNGSDVYTLSTGLDATVQRTYRVTYDRTTDEIDFYYLDGENWTQLGTTQIVDFGEAQFYPGLYMGMFNTNSPATVYADNLWLSYLPFNWLYYESEITTSFEENYVLNETIQLEWDVYAEEQEVEIAITYNGGLSYSVLDTVDSDTSYTFDLTETTISTSAKVRLTILPTEGIYYGGYDGLTYSDSVLYSPEFIVLPEGAYIEILSPLTLSQLLVGSSIDIQVRTSAVDSIRIEWGSDTTSSWNLITRLQTDAEVLDTVSYSWTLPDNITSPFYLKAVEDGDTVIYVYNKELTLIGTTMPTYPQICWYSHEDRPVQSYLSYDQSCGWVSGFNHTLVITEIIDDGTYSRIFITCDRDCNYEAGENMDMTFVTVGAQQYTMNQFYTFGQSVTYKGRKYYTGSKTLWMDDLINDIDSIFVADLAPYIDISNGFYHTGWTDTPSLLQLYHVQKEKIRGNTYPPDQVFEDLNDSWFKPKILIGGSYFGHGGLLVYSIDALPAPNTLTPEEDIVELSGGVYRNYFRGIVPRAITNIELQPGQ